MENQGRARAGIFSLFKNSDRVLVHSAGHKIPLQPGWYLRPQKIPLAEETLVMKRKIERKNLGSALRAGEW